MSKVEFGSLFEFIRNGMNVRQNKSGNGLPISRIETIWNSNIDPQRVGYAGLEVVDCAGWLLSPGDILFSHINSVEHIGKCAVYEGFPDRLVHGMNLLCLRCKPDSLLPSYAKHLIRSDGFKARLSSYINKAVNQASVSIGNLKGIEVTVPSLPEQCRIAAILDKADALRTKRREALAQLDRLAQSIFVEMFGDQRPASLGGDTCTLAGLVEINPRITADERLSLSETDVAFLPMASVSDSEQRVVSPQLRPFTEVSKGYTPIKRGDVIVAKITPCYENGKMALLDDLSTEFGFGSTEFHVFRAPSRDIALFVYFFLRLGWIADAGAKAMKGAAGQKRVPADFFESLRVARPDDNKLQEFAVRIEKIERLKTKFRCSVLQSNAQFESLQHRAFLGQL